MSDGYRKAALKLHGMSDADRGWMLQRLPQDERARLNALLRELRDLGIKPDQRVSDGVAAEEARQTFLSAIPEHSEVASALDILCAANPGEISAVLSAEPENMVAAVLAVYPWTWRVRFLADCGAEKRQRLNRALMHSPQLKPRLRGELIKLLSDKVASLRNQGFLWTEIIPSERAAAANVPRMRSIWKGIRRWLP